MIVSFRDEWLRAFFVEDKRSRNIPTDLEERLFRKLQMIDDATTDQDLRVPPKAGWGLVESIWDSQISVILIHHAGWEGGQHGWASLIL